MEELFCESCLELAECIITQISSEFEGAREERQDYLIDSFHAVLDYVVLLESLRPEFSLLVDVLTALNTAMNASMEARVHLARTRGRPKLSIENDQLQYLLETSFRIKDICVLLGCSRSTIERRMHDGQLSIYSSVTDSELDNAVRRITSSHPFCGQKTILGRLRSMSIRVQRRRVRESMCRVDPIGIENRKRKILHRRVYSVESPNALWHLDGYHKLIRWKFVIHGAIDGYSRLITYLRVSTNNRASTVLGAFRSAIEHYGLPSRIRTDRGGENVLVAEHLLNHPLRANHLRPVIVGKSVHNQRIERLWRDLYSGCISFFYNLFYFLEDVGVLDVNNDSDLYTLQFVSLPHIQVKLDQFRDGWANHGLRTEHNQTPLQLWVMGLQGIHASNPNHTALDGIEEVMFAGTALVYIETPKQPFSPLPIKHAV